MNESKHRKERLEGARGWISMIPLYAWSVENVRWEGSLCHSNVHHLFRLWGRIDNASDGWWQRQLVRPTSPCLWSNVRWCSGQKNATMKAGKKRGRRIIKTVSLTCANGKSMPGWHIRQYLLCHGASLVLPFPICPSSRLQPPAKGHWGCQLNQVTFLLFHFFHPKFEYEKVLSYPVKDHHFNDIWQSFDLLGFRGWREEIH